VNCYYHPGVEAVGVCKNCFKGICSESAADVGDGLACKGACEKQVRQYNRKMANATPGAWSLANGIIGVIFVALGALLWGEGEPAAWLFIAMGIVFAATGAWVFVTARRQGA
jgi:hypothetical protein